MPTPRLSLAAVLLVSVMGPALASGAALLSHRAVYDIGLVAEKSKGLVGASGRIAGYKGPQSVRFLADAEMPRTATGKILHRMLRDLMAAPGGR